MRDRRQTRNTRNYREMSYPHRKIHKIDFQNSNNQLFFSFLILDNIIYPSNKIVYFSIFVNINWIVNELDNYY